MNKEAILRTAVCRYDPHEGVYVVESPLFANVIGADLSEKKAWKVYRELFSDMWEAHLEGLLAAHARPGRPSKGIVNVNVQVSPEIRELLRQSARALGVSQGDFVAFAIKAAEAHLSLQRDFVDVNGPSNKVNSVAERHVVDYLSLKSMGKRVKAKATKKALKSKKHR